MAHKIFIIGSNKEAKGPIIKKELTVMYETNDGAWLAHDENDRLYSNELNNVVKALQQDLKSPDADDRLIASILLLGIKYQPIFYPKKV